MKCLVRKLQVSIKNDELPLLVNFKNYIAPSSNEQYIKVVGSELPIKSFPTQGTIVKVTFTNENQNTVGRLIVGKAGAAYRLLGRKPYLADSVGANEYQFSMQYATGSPTDVALLTKGNEYVAEFTMNSLIVGDNSVANTGAYANTVDMLSMFNDEGGTEGRIGMFKIKNVCIEKNNGEKLLDVYPAVDAQGVACVYDVVNKTYYYANSGVMVVE